MALWGDETHPYTWDRTLRKGYLISLLFCLTVRKTMKTISVISAITRTVALFVSAHMDFATKQTCFQPFCVAYPPWQKKARFRPVFREDSILAEAVHVPSPCCGNAMDCVFIEKDGDVSDELKCVVNHCVCTRNGVESDEQRMKAI